MFKVPNKYRIRKDSIFRSDDSYGNNGAFQIPLEKGIIANVIASDGSGWEHVSVHIFDQGNAETPTWDEMCIIKDYFWDLEDCVIQYHPPRSNYISQHDNVLHLWRPTDPNMQIPIPEPILVGFKKKV